MQYIVNNRQSQVPLKSRVQLSELSGNEVDKASELRGQMNVRFRFSQTCERRRMDIYGKVSVMKKMKKMKKETPSQR